MVMKEEQERVRTLIADTVTLLCRNGLTYKSKFCINALIGITLDENDVFLLDIRETIKTAEDANSCDDNSLLSDETTPKKSTRKRQKRKRGAEKSKQAEAKDSGSEEVVDSDNDNSSNTFSEKIIKQETEDDDSEDLVFIKDEPGTQTVSSYTGPMGDEHSLTQQEQPLLGEDSLETISPQQGALFGTSTLAPDTSAGPSSWSHQTPFPQIVQSTSTSDLKPKQQCLSMVSEKNDPLMLSLPDRLSPLLDQRETMQGWENNGIDDINDRSCQQEITPGNHIYKQNSTGVMKSNTCNKKSEQIAPYRLEISASALPREGATVNSDPNLACPYCNNVYSNSTSFKRHVNTHLGKFSFWCEECNRGFHHKYAYHAHLGSQHNMAAMKTACPVCGKIFTRKDNMKAHMKILHQMYD